jgi:hypothetical protein
MTEQIAGNYSLVYGFFQQSGTIYGSQISCIQDELNGYYNIIITSIFNAFMY